MSLGDYYLHDRRVVLLPIEALGPSGLSPELSQIFVERGALPRASLALFDAGFALYWQRSSALAARTRTWPAPRLRHVAVVVGDSIEVRPYAQMLNTSAWTLYSADLDAAASHPELVAYLLAHGDRMAVSGEVTMVAVQAAAWWLERDDAECDAFAEATRRSTRPDADGFRAIGEALPWLRQLRHETLRPPVRLAVGARGAANLRSVPGTGLLVPVALEKRPLALVERWKAIATRVVAAYHARWKTVDADATASLLSWLAAERPRLLITGRREAILWDSEAPEALGALRHELRSASGAGVHDIDADLRVIDEHSRRFLASLVDAASLPPPQGEPLQLGYAYLHRSRRLIAYNLHETWIERLRGPALPYARAMLGARTIHEWCHLAVDAGCVPQTASEVEMQDVLGDLGEQLDAVVRDAPPSVRSVMAEDLRPLGPRPGRALAAGIVERFADYRANLLAQRYLSEAERETYVRQNVRTLRGEYRAPQVLRMLVRYLYEMEYLRFSRVADPRAFFLHSTWFDDDFLRTRILDEKRFDALRRTVGRLCDAYAVDESRFV